MERSADGITETTTDPFASIAEFLEEASAALAGDPIAARTCIARAAMLLREVQARHAPASGETAARGNGPGLARWKLNHVMRHVEQHLDGNLRVRDLAKLTGLSPGHFARAFQQSVGVAPRHFLIERRIERAKALMRTTDLTLCEIALASGLSDQAHLSRLFRRHTGTTPNAWRREWRAAEQRAPAFVRSPRILDDPSLRMANVSAG
ncbi:AraC family transcriptional regulator [Rhodopseudomonas sp. HC1]|uniref:helix-turn-helix domain-containing protein n=1 Tax=Rhodopseudomonas infernalis TaxID=2897386 RepID=UPI001EE794F0|nr:AraC family transcriptional regulator [Rhodopseudomonas infernalis]MCG6206969.1 AraC family transcriptional regulator [Rhodopseudomonas infernalis]